MPSQLATLLCVAFVFWLFVRERRGRTPMSAALWLPVLWMTMLGSRAASSWFGLGKEMESTQDYLEGSPFDRLIFQVLIGVACIVLMKRRIDWRAVFTANRWVMFYFLYLGVSVLWSDYTLTAFKRWVKDAGSVLMILIILTEASPRQALKSVFLRCAYILVPFSVLFIKYLPDLGRTYNRWTYEVENIGVTMSKNMLGMSLFICTLAVVWTMLAEREENAPAWEWRRRPGELVLILMLAWLLQQAHSATAQVCTILGSGILLATRVAAIREKLQRHSAYLLPAVVLLVGIGQTLGLHEVLISSLGRNMTFTGRDDIWKAVLAEDINPLFGVGHYSFWLGERVERISKGYYFLINEAHNGYLEVYLNVGLIGLGLLVVILVTGWRKNFREALAGDSDGAFRLALLVGTLVYGLTEAVFRLGFLSSALLAAVLVDPRAPALQQLGTAPVLVADPERHSAA